jgi:cysteine desulfurase
MKPVFEDTIESVYLDNAATTMMDDEVVNAMLPYLQERYGNPATPYHLGRDAGEGVDEAREAIAELLGADTGEIVFTSGGTESNNWAVKCAGWLKEGKTNNKSGRYKAVCSAVEHNSVLECVKYSPDGVIVPVSPSGRISIPSLTQALAHDDVRIVSVQHCNNEIGTIQDIPLIADLVHRAGAILHVDAVQSFGKWKWDVDDLKADLVSVSAHKIHGPMGIGALWIKEGTPIHPLLEGGGQERERRSGTLAVPNIVGFGKAAQQAWSNVRTESKRQRKMSDTLARGMSVRHGITRNGDNLAPHIVSLNLPEEAAVVAAVLNRQYGVCVACGSACDTKKKQSHVLGAIGLNFEEQQRVLRVSVGRFNTDRHIRMLISGFDMAFREAKERSLE